MKTFLPDKLSDCIENTGKSWPEVSVTAESMNYPSRKVSATTESSGEASGTFSAIAESNSRQLSGFPPPGNVSLRVTAPYPQ